MIFQAPAYLMRLIPAAALAALLSACSVGPGYYWQAATGHLDILARSTDAASLASRPDTAAPLHERLTLAADIRRFASASLRLPDNDSYRSYADLGRPFVVWNVFASPELAMRAQEWCLPVAGCVSYLGYFSEAAAREKAAELRAQGADVFVGGVPAYSTLGWFDDPLLSTFIHWPEPELARLIFHELAHQVTYVKDDTEFNESFAAAVEEIGVRRYLAQPGKETLRPAFDRAQIARADFAALILKTRDALTALYASNASDDEKRARKQTLLQAMHTEYHELKTTRWGGFNGYDRWFAQDINNAALNSVGLYKALVPDFLALLDRHGGDLPAFYRAVSALAKLPADERRAQLRAAASLRAGPSH